MLESLKPNIGDYIASTLESIAGTKRLSRPKRFQMFSDCTEMPKLGRIGIQFTSRCASLELWIVTIFRFVLRPIAIHQCVFRPIYSYLNRFVHAEATLLRCFNSEANG